MVNFKKIENPAEQPLLPPQGCGKNLHNGAFAPRVENKVR